jgi:hypothetical protein
MAGREFSSVAGVLSDLMRFEAFIPDLMTIRGSVAYLAATDALGGQLSLSPGVLIPTGDDGGETELILDYGARVALQQNQLRLVGGLDGRTFLTEDGSFSERTAHQLLAAASYGFGRFRPGLHVRTVLDEDWSDEVNVAFGVSLEVLLGPLPVRTARR